MSRIEIVPPCLIWDVDGTLIDTTSLIAESLACGMPVIITEVMPDQERGNAEVVVESGAGEVALGPGKLVEVLGHWLAHDGRLLSERGQRAQALGRPRAAYTVAEYVWALLESSARTVAESVP